MMLSAKKLVDDDIGDHFRCWRAAVGGSGGAACPRQKLT